MTGTKASALAEWTKARDRAFLRFDYFGHGVSDGAFTDGTMSLWRADMAAMLDALVDRRKCWSAPVSVAGCR